MPELSEDEKAIFEAALSLEDADQQAEYLNIACRGSAELRRQIDSLLAAYARAGTFMYEPAVNRIATTSSLEELGTAGEQIGRYKLLQKIGEGGFGIVYMAEQHQPVYRRVALKIIKQGMDTRQVIGRFEAERQALAMMDHPNIARVLDAGATERGRPYFVMELVRGVPITEFCDQNKLDTRERLELIIEVCNAVQHAHQKGIIHRDIKPSNVMVTLYDDQPVPKVIDFGIAKATQQRLTEKTVFTDFNQFLGTPVYMSPEQATLSGLDIDTRSDIYALGVLLYELLTGTTPYDPQRLRRTGYDELCRIIREEVPQTPSRRVSTLGERLAIVSRTRSTEPVLLRRLLRGDVDWIVMKAIEKDRKRRYETANGLAMDIRRHLKHEPVLAGPPSAVYRLRKFARRNRPIIAAAALVGAVLLVGTVLSTWQAVRASRAYGMADREREQAVKAEEFAQAALVGSRRSEAELALEKGQLLGDQRDANLALLWMADALKTAPEEAQDLRRAIRINLSAWSQQLHQVQRVLVHEGRVQNAAFAPDGRTLLTAASVANEGYGLYRWDPRSGSLVAAPMRGLSGTVLSTAFDPTARLLAVGYLDGRIQLLDVATGTAEQLSAADEAGPVTALLFSPQGEELLIARGVHAENEAEDLDANSSRFTGPGSVQIVEVPSGKPMLAGPLRHEELVWTAAFSPDRKTFVTVSGDWADAQSNVQARFWDFAGKEVRKPLQHLDPTLTLSFSPDGRQLLSGHSDFRARLWNLSADEDTRLELVMPHEAPVAAVAFHPHERDVVLLSDYGGTARLWNLGTGKPLGPPLSHQHPVRCVQFSPDGRHVLSGTGTTARLWKLAELEAKVPTSVYTPELFPLAIDHATNRLLVHGADGSLAVRDAAAGHVIGTAIPYADPIIAGAFSRDGRYAAAIGIDHRVRLWELEQGRMIGVLEFPGRAYSVAFSPDGHTVATGHSGDVAAVWDVLTAQKKATLRHQHGGPVFSIQYSPDGKTILTGGGDSMARLWDVRTMAEIRSFPQRTAALDAEFSPDGTKIVTCGTGEGARVWVAATGRPLGVPLRHEGMIFAARFSLDGRMLLTGGLDGTARLWDIATSKQLGPSMQHDERVHRVGFWPDGRTIVTSTASTGPGESRPGKAHYWPLPTPIAGTDEQINLWAETITSMQLDEKGGVLLLEPHEWQDRRRDLE